MLNNHIICITYIGVIYTCTKVQKTREKNTFREKRRILEHAQGLPHGYLAHTLSIKDLLST